jgi:hypothetical protein
MPFSRAIAFLLCAVFALVCLSKARLIGDGMEYLAMAQGFVAHGSPELRPSDIAALKAMPPKALARARLEPDVLAQAFEHVRGEGSIELGFARGSDGGVHAIHFWMYSLLAAPFYALVTLLGQNPFMALVALNLVILGATAWRLRAWLPAAGLPELGLLLLMGPAYYTVWIGPEVMTGCCVLLATIAALRRDLPLMVALAGLGATQNPSVAGLIPAAAAYALLYRWFPSTALLPVEQRTRPLRAVLLVLAGLVAAVLPYLHNQALFGMPSIIGHYYTDIGLITPERLFSFLFDLNQGMLIGLPGLPACIALVTLAIAPAQRSAWLPQLAIALLLTLGMALPTLGAVNWNSGALIVSRYAYWCAMPLLAVCLAGLVQLDMRRRWLVLVLAVLLQGLAGWQAYRSRGPAFTAHGRLAAWVLDHAPRYYNPDPEIFLERERHREDLATHDQVVVHRGPDGPTKLMRFWSNSLDAGGLCAPGTHLGAAQVRTLASGWRYYNAPLHCKPGPAPVLRVEIGPATPPILGTGWSLVQGKAVWNEGPRATLRVPLPAGRRPGAIGLDGHYHAGLRSSRIVINGIDLGEFALGQAPLALPAALASARVLDIEIVHTTAPGPASERDPRALGFLLQGVSVEFAD